MTIITDFLFAEVATGRPVEVLRTGTFIDRNGKEVIITEGDIDEMIANFEAGEAGQDVPIDIDHERAAAAGWIKRLWREGQKLLAEPDWNSLGKNLVGDRVYKYLSATIDMTKKVVKTISLVNMPAVKGLKPVELSEGEGVYSLRVEGQAAQLLETLASRVSEIYTRLFNEKPIILTEDVMTVTELEVNRDKLRAELKAEVEAELAQKRQTEAELREQVKAELEAELGAKFERRAGLVEFANKVCGGDAGLATPPNELVELMETLDDDQLERFKAVLNAKVVSFQETGSSQNGRANLVQLPDYAVADVKAGRLTVAELFQAKAVAGKAEDYDLSGFDEDQIGL